MRPLYVMLIGLPGSGKSYLADKIAEKFLAAKWSLVSSDRYIENYARITNKDYDQVFKEAIDGAAKYMNAMRELGFRERQNIIHDQTNLSVPSRAKKLATIPREYAKIGILCSVDEAVRQERMAARAGKFIPEHVDIQMRMGLQQPTLAEGFDVAVPSYCWEAIIGSYME